MAHGLQARLAELWEELENAGAIPASEERRREG